MRFWNFPWYELSFALAAYVMLLSFLHFALRRRPVLFEGVEDTKFSRVRSPRARLVFFAAGSAVAVVAGGNLLARLTGSLGVLWRSHGLSGFCLGILPSHGCFATRRARPRRSRHRFRARGGARGVFHGGVLLW